MADVIDLLRSDQTYATISGSNNETITCDVQANDQTAFSKVKHATGKYYVEVLVGSTVGSYGLLGVTTDNHTGTDRLSDTSYAWSLMSNNRLYHDTQYITGDGAWVADDVVGIAVDIDGGKIFYSINGVWQGDPEAGTGEQFLAAGISNGGDISIGLGVRSVGEAFTLRVEKADFDYAIPDGFDQWLVLPTFYVNSVPDTNKLTLTLDSSGITEDQINFPLTIHLDGTDPLHAAVFADLGANSKKLSIEQGSTQLPIEIEYWDDTNELATLHTKVPTYDADSDGVLTLSFDSSQEDNTNYVGEVGDTAETVLDSDFGTGTSASAANYTRRWVIETGAIVRTGNTIQVDFMTGTADYIITGAYIGICTGTSVFDGNQVQLTMHGSTTMDITTDDHISDPIEFDIDGTDDIMISIFHTEMNARILTTIPANHRMYYKAGDYAADDAPSGMSEYTTRTEVINNLIITTPSQKVWDSNFMMVLHMNNAVTGDIFDSTGNGNDWTVVGAVSLEDGLYGKALEFDGTAEYLSYANFQAPATAITAEAFVYQTSRGPGGSGLPCIISHYDTITTFFLGVDDGDTDDAGDVRMQIYSGSGVDATSVDPIALDTWAYLGGKYDGSDISIAVDDITPVTEAKTGSMSTTNTGTANIGILNATNLNNGFIGKIGEVRLSKIARSDDWITLTNLSLIDALVTVSEYVIPEYEPYKYTFTIPAKTEYLADFPITLKLGAQSGISNFDTSAIFSTLTGNYDKLIVTDSLGTVLPVEVEHWGGFGDEVATYPPAHNATYVLATSIFSTSYYQYFATDPAKSLTGTYLNNAWVSVNTADTDQKFNIDYGTAFVASQIYLENGHHNGGSTNIGIKNFILYGTNDATAFGNTTYSNTDDLVELGTYLADEHTASDIADPQYFSISKNTTPYRYYVLRIADNYGETAYMGIRHIALQEYTESNLIPQDEGTVIENAGGLYAGSMFNGDLTGGGTSEAWYASDPAYQTTGWGGKDFGAGNAKKVTKFNLYVNTIDNDYNARNFTVQASNDGSNYDTLLTVTDLDISTQGWQSWTFENTTAYRYWRLNVSSNWGDATYLLVQEISFETVAEPKATLHTKTTLYPSQTNHIVLDYNPSNADNSAYIAGTEEGTSTDVTSALTVTSYGGSSNYTHRQIIESAAITAANGAKQLAFMRLSTDWTIDECWIYIQDPDGTFIWDGLSGSGVQVTFGGSASDTITADGQLSDVFDFDIGENDSVIIAVFFSSNGSPYLATPANYTGKYQSGNTSADEVPGTQSSWTNVSSVKQIVTVPPNQAVWDTTSAIVHHMAQDPSGGSDCILDSTYNANHGTPSGTMLTEDLVDAISGKGIEFDGSNDYISVADNPSWDIGTGDFTVSQMINLSDVSSGVFFALDSYTVGIMAYFFTSTFWIYVVNGSNSETLGVTTTQDFLLTVKRVSGTVHIFVDDTEIGTGTTLSGSISTTQGWRFGYGFDGAANDYITGVVSETRVGLSARSDLWIGATSESLTDILGTWNFIEAKNYNLYLAIPAQTESLVDFPVTIMLGEASGTNNFDTSDIFIENPLVPEVFEFSGTTLDPAVWDTVIDTPANVTQNDILVVTCVGAAAWSGAGAVLKDEFTWSGGFEFSFIGNFTEWYYSGPPGAAIFIGKVGTSYYTYYARPQDCIIVQLGSGTNVCKITTIIAGSAGTTTEDSNTVLNPDTNYHIRVVMIGDVLKVYVDSVEYLSTTISSADKTALGDDLFLQFGASGYSNDGSFYVDKLACDWVMTEPWAGLVITDTSDNILPVEVECWDGVYSPFIYAPSGNPTNQFIFDSDSGTTLYAEVGTIDAVMTNQTIGELNGFPGNYLVGSYTGGATSYYTTFDSGIAFKSASIWVKVSHNIDNDCRIFTSTTNAVNFGTKDQYQGADSYKVYIGATLSEFKIEDNDWHHFCIVEEADNDTHWVYVDGVRSSTALNSQFDGLIHLIGDTDSPLSTETPHTANLQIYDYALSDAEVALLADSAKPQAVLHTKATLGTDETVLTLNYDPTNNDNSENVSKLAPVTEVFGLYDLVTDSTWIADYNFRIIIPAASLTAGSLIKVVFDRHAVDYDISGCYIGLKATAGDAWDFEEAPTQVTFDGGNNGATITEEFYESDPVSFDIDGTADIIVSFHSPDQTRSYRANAGGASTYQRQSATDESDLVDPAGYTSAANWRCFSGIVTHSPAYDVWNSDYGAVYHMAQDPSGGADCILDSTDNILTGTPVGTMLTADLIDGLVGKALNFDGSDDYINIGEAFDFAGNDFAVECLVNRQGDTGRALFFGQSDTGGTTANVSVLIEFDATNYIKAYFTNGTTLYSVAGTTAITDSDWHYVVFKRDTNDFALYLDDVLIDSDTQAITVNSPAYDFTIGAGGEYTLTRFAGDIDEIRVSLDARSDNWIGATNESLTDALITYSISTGAVTPPDPDPETGYRKPRYAFPGFPNPYKTTIVFAGFGKGSGNLLPKYSTFSG